MLRLLSLLALLAAPAAFAAPVTAGGYSLELVDTAGRPLETHYHRGTTYVVGHYGARYNVRVVNRTHRRIEAVVTVDGRDVINGSNGAYSNRGYIIDPYGSVTIEGFRKSHHDVAAFRFTNPSDSYAGRRGSTRNVGVVGVAVFAERDRPRPKPIARPRPPHRQWGALDYDARTGAGGQADDRVAEAAPAPRASRAKGYGRRPAKRRTSNNIGTRYGESVQSDVVEVAFRRGSSSPARVLSLRYDDVAGLQAKGIITRRHYSGTPNPFPGREFAPPPR